MPSSAQTPGPHASGRRVFLAMLAAVAVSIPVVTVVSRCCRPSEGRLEAAAIPARQEFTGRTGADGSSEPFPERPRSLRPSGDAAADEPTDGTVRPDADTSQAKIDRARLTGVWEDDYQGHRTMTLRPDGTGRMVVELDGVAASLFASTLTFGEEWSFDEDSQLITMTATGGEPQGKVNLVLKLYGRQATYRVVDVSKTRLILVDQADGKRYEWRRVKEEAEQ